MKRAPARTWLPTVLAVLLAVAPSARANMLVNPGFEDGGGSYNGWTLLWGSGPNISTAATDSIVRSGVAAAKIFGEFTDCPIPNFDDSGFGQKFTPSAGMVYELSGYSFVSSADPMVGTNTCAVNRCIAKIAFFSSPVGGLLLSANEIVVGDGNTTPLDTWIPFRISAPAPAGAMRMEVLFIFLQPGCDDGSVFLDDLSLIGSPAPAPLPNVLANPSFDTGITGWSKFGNALAENRGFGIRTAPGSAKMWGPFGNPGDASGLWQSFPVTSGLDWRMSVWTMHTCQESPIGPGNTNFATAKIVFRDAGGTELAFAEETIVDANSPLATWMKHTVVAATPAGAATVEAYLLFIQPDSTAQGAVWFDDVRLSEAVLVDAPVVAESVTDFELRQNVPNPFGSSTRIEFVLPRTAPVELGVYDVGGRLVRTLVDRPLAPGGHVVTWDGRAADGGRAAAGIYRYVLRTPSGKTARSMMLLR